jgi:tRNA threonylcarbamoyl adenosine modification protein YjeE
MTTEMTTAHTFHACDEPSLARLAELCAFAVRPGDLITLTGDLGAGKTTFARAFVLALSAPDVIEVPSPTFTLVQTYQTARITVAHFDLYRLNDPAELTELGLDDAVTRGAALVEWPDRGGAYLTGNTLALTLKENATNPDTRDIHISADPAWAARLTRLIAIRAFLDANGRGSAHIRYLQGDASVRRYARLFEPGHAPIVLMDWPRQPDGPPIRDGKPYSQIAHLAEGVRPFVAIGTALADAGLSTPKLLAHDLDAGLLIIEDFGDQVFGPSIDRVAPQATLWQAGVDTLVALRRSPPPAANLPLPDGTSHTTPHYNHEALGIETELLLDWYWPACHGTAVPADIRAHYTQLWTTIFDRTRPTCSGCPTARHPATSALSTSRMPKSAPTPTISSRSCKTPASMSPPISSKRSSRAIARPSPPLIQPFTQHPSAGPMQHLAHNAIPRSSASSPASPTAMASPTIWPTSRASGATSPAISPTPNYQNSANGLTAPSRQPPAINRSRPHAQHQRACPHERQPQMAS